VKELEKMADILLHGSASAPGRATGRRRSGKVRQRSRKRAVFTKQLQTRKPRRKAERRRDHH
jgi:hypothetical protein